MPLTGLPTEDPERESGGSGGAGRYLRESVSGGRRRNFSRRASEILNETHDMSILAQTPPCQSRAPPTQPGAGDYQGSTVSGNLRMLMSDRTWTVTREARQDRTGQRWRKCRRQLVPGALCSASGCVPSRCTSRISPAPPGRAPVSVSSRQSSARTKADRGTATNAGVDCQRMPCSAIWYPTRRSCFTSAAPPYMSALHRETEALPAPTTPTKAKKRSVAATNDAIATLVRAEPAARIFWTLEAAGPSHANILSTLIPFRISDKVRIRLSFSAMFRAWNQDSAGSVPWRRQQCGANAA
eukprot:3412823-Rhodomonas_salina.3